MITQSSTTLGKAMSYSLKFDKQSYSIYFYLRDYSLLQVNSAFRIVPERNSA